MDALHVDVISFLTRTPCFYVLLVSLIFHAQVRLPDSIYDSVASTLPLLMARRVDAWCSQVRSAEVAKTALLEEPGLKPGSFCVWRSTEGSCVLATLQAGGRVIQFPLVQVRRRS